MKRKHRPGYLFKWAWREFCSTVFAAVFRAFLSNRTLQANIEQIIAMDYPRPPPTDDWKRAYR